MTYVSSVDYTGPILNLIQQAFNEELDGMFNDASLPEDEAWVALAREATESKKAKNEADRQILYVLLLTYFDTVLRITSQTTSTRTL